MAVEEAALRTNTHRIQPQADPLEDLLCVQWLVRRIEIAVFLHAKLEQIFHDGIIRGLQAGKIGILRQVELLIEPGQHDLNGVYLHVGEILIAAEPVLQECQMLTQPSASAEGFRCIRVIHRLTGPGFGFQEVNHVSAVQEIQITAAIVLSQCLHLTLGIQSDNPFARLPQIGHQQL